MHTHIENASTYLKSLNNYLKALQHESINFGIPWHNLNKELH